ncbi:MAG: hypothetical protein ACYS1A_00340 [Planctomycetota bacterium]|jgi:hypothetical protein
MMKTKKWWILTAALAVCIAGVWAVRSFAELTDKQLSLNNIEALYVFTQGFTEEAKKAGLKKEPIQSYVEAKLKGAGIKIASEEEGLELPGRPVLYVNITARKREKVSVFVYHIDVGILQEVALVRDPTIHAMSITWNRGSLGHCPSTALARSIRGTVGYLMDKFTSDYKTANPEL